MKRIAIYISIITVVSCTVNKTLQTENKDVTLGGKLFTAAYQQRAAEYKALCLQSYNLAKEKLDAALTRSYNKPTAIITDVDETVLDNSAYAVHRALLGKDYESVSWNEWTAKAMADTVPGAPAFLKYAASKGVQIFYITNREEKERTGTMQNLKKFNFPNTDDAHLLLKQTTSGKESRRQQVMKDHEVLLLLGDNLSDFNSLFDKQTDEKRAATAYDLTQYFGSKYIVLPNPNYGDWELALYKYNYSLTQAQKDSVLKTWLKGY
jgi:5'-nucleotidase (lipoprotein e(P4) family)